MTTPAKPVTPANPNPTVQVTGDKDTEFAKKLMERSAAEAAAIKPQQTFSGQDAVVTDLTDSSKKNFDQKIYWMPESFNALRRELVENWPEIWPLVSYVMAFDGPEFVNRMNEGLELKLQFDTNNVDAICKTYLNALRAKRGISAIH